uniref:Ig-like domain-containing protein n=1 Tax=Anas platyrhynchos platyrhynchos TaxID=8840 RepID=A0A493TGH0_ANAPP
MGLPAAVSQPHDAAGALSHTQRGASRHSPAPCHPHAVQNPLSRSWGAPGHPLPALPHPHSSQDPQDQRGSCRPLSQPLAFPMVLQASTPNPEGFPPPHLSSWSPHSIDNPVQGPCCPKVLWCWAPAQSCRDASGQCVVPVCTDSGVCTSLKGQDCGCPSPPVPHCVSGSHTWQVMSGCDLLEDGSIRGFSQYGYEGRDFIALDKDALTFTAADAGAQITKRKWEEDGTVAEQWKNYLENTCIEGLRKYVSYGKDVLERRERPEVRVSGMEADKILTLSCRAHGFYPRPISISWLKDGVVQEQETRRGSTVPNSDGTYHAWATIDVLSGDRDKYQCRVEHASLPQPGLFSWEPQSNLIPIVVGVAVAVVAVIAALAGFAVWKSKQGKKEKGYYVAPGSNPSV